MINVQRENEIQEIIKQFGYSRVSAEEIYSMRHSNSAKCIRIRAIMEEKNCSYSKAKYIYGKELKNEPYKERDYCKGVTLEDIKGYSIVKDEKELGGWRVYKNDVLIKLYIKDNHLYIQEYIGGEPCSSCKYGWKNFYKLIPLASLVWMLHNDKAIERGYCINHIDHNPFRNDIENLEYVSDSDNKKLARRTGNKGYNK